LYNKRGKVLIAGHRGCGDNTYLSRFPGSYWIPENSLASFTKAILSGVDAIECDIHVSSDNVPMIIHNNSVTTNAYYIGACDKEYTRERTKYCSSYTAVQLQSEFVLKSPLCVPFLPLNGETVEQQRELLQSRPDSFRLPTLRELLTLVHTLNRQRALSNQRLVTMNIELKGLNSAVAVLLELSNFAAAKANSCGVDRSFIPMDHVILLGKLPLAEIAVAQDLICCSREARDSLGLGPVGATGAPLRLGAEAVAEHYCEKRLGLYLAGGGAGPNSEAATKLLAAGALAPYSVLLFDTNECLLVDGKGQLVRRGREGPKCVPLAHRGDLPLAPAAGVLRSFRVTNSAYGSCRAVLLAAVQALLPHLLHQIVPQKHQPGQIRTQLARALQLAANTGGSGSVGSLDEPAQLCAAFHRLCPNVADVRCTLMVSGEQLYGTASNTTTDANATPDANEGAGVETETESAEADQSQSLSLTPAGHRFVEDCFRRGFSGLDLNLRCLSPALLEALQSVISSPTPRCRARPPVFCPVLGVNACRAPWSPQEVLLGLQDFTLSGAVDVIVKVNKLQEYGLKV
jgi:glycerophosphoryl diester phosphodiesterase